MEDTPNAAVEAQAPKTEAQPINTQTEASAQDMHGFTSDQLADMKKFFDANGGYDKIKSRISNPEPKQVEQPVAPAQPQVQEQTAQPYQQPARMQQPMRTPEGMLSRNDLLMKGYYERLAGEEEYKPIAKEITGGSVLKEMEMLGINPTDSNGFIDDKKIRAFLSIKAKTVPAVQTSTTPESSSAPTVDYVQVGENIESLDQARAVLRQDSQLRASGRGGHPSIEKAREYLKNMLNPNSK